MTDRETELKEELGDAIRRANELDALLAERDDEVYRHEVHIGDLVEARVRDREANEEKDSHIAYLESLIKTKSNRIAELKSKLVDSENEASILLESLDEGEKQYKELEVEFSQYILKSRKRRKKFKKKFKRLKGCYDVQYHNLGVYLDMNESLEAKNKELEVALHSGEISRQKLCDEIDSSEAQVESLTEANDNLKLEIEEMKARSII